MSLAESAFSGKTRHPAAVEGRAGASELPIVIGLVLLMVNPFIAISHPLHNVNEGLYARIAQEMLGSGDWIIPTLNGVPYLEKPPLMYWLGALSYRAFGFTEWAARLPAVLGIFLSVSALYWFARRRINKAAAFLVMVVQGTFWLNIAAARALIFDSLFTGFFTWAVVLLYEAHRPPGQRLYMRASLVFLALAILTKGLAALVFYVAIEFLWLVLGSGGERVRQLRVFRDPVAWAAFFTIVVPWHLLASLREVGFAWFYFVNEHVLRFLGMRTPADYHTGSWWFYFPRLALSSLPWIVLLAFPARNDAPPLEKPLRQFLWIWLAVPVAVFSLSVAKGDYYLIVALPGLAVMIGERLSRLKPTKYLSAVPLVIAGAVFGWTALTHGGGLKDEDARWLLALFCGLCLASAWSWFTHRLVLAALFLAGLVIPLELMFASKAIKNEAMKSAKTLAYKAGALGGRIFIYREFEQVSALLFYLNRPVGIVDSQSNDLAWGIAHVGDAERFPSSEQFKKMVMQEGAVLLVTENRNAEFYASALAPVCAHAGIVGRTALFMCRPANGGKNFSSSDRRPVP
jgi:4-amino-4-deoxy-L-arabinose transferase-like glycosyltransferase